MNFDYREGNDHVLITKADGLEIEIHFTGYTPDEVHFSDMEFAVGDDAYNGLYVNIGHGLNVNIVPISYVIEQAEKQIEEIVSEVETEQRDWARHVRSFS